MVTVLILTQIRIIKFLTYYRIKLFIFPFLSYINHKVTEKVKDPYKKY